MCVSVGTIFPQSETSGERSRTIPNPQSQDSPEQLFQAGIYAEEVQGDLREALEIYQKIVKDYPDQRPVAAKAQLHIGLCYEKLGHHQARAAYQKVLQNYPDQREAVAVARERLAHLKKTSISPLVKYYFERLGIDITTSTSYDGKYLAYTDWLTGSLMISDWGLGISDFGNSLPQSQIRNPKSNHSEIKNPKCIAPADFSRSPEYAYYPAWSRDGKFIAYGWYRKPYHVELRVVSVADGKIEVIYSDPRLIIMPDDWSPDGKTIACETLNFDGSSKKLALVRVDQKKLQDVLALSGDTRRVNFSPDGEYVVYNLARHQQIFVLSLEDLQQTELSVEFAGTSGFVGHDGPVWSPDGNLVLCRNLGNQNLFAIPVQNGKQTAKSYMVQADLSNALLIMKGIRHPTAAEANRAMKKKANLRNAMRSFEEEFSSPVLDSAWSVFEWKGPNVYDRPSFGRYSLADHPGHLRYYLEQIMFPGHHTGYAPRFGGWYWSYPGLEISRVLVGDHWVLEAKATYHLVDGANGREFALAICFDQERDRQTVLQIGRGKDIREKDGTHYSLFADRGIVINETHNFISPRDTLGVSRFTYVYRLTRADTLVQVELSEDEGKSFQRVLSAELRPELRGLTQSLILTGGSWFVPAGAYADWDYIRFRNSDLPISDFGFLISDF